MQHKKKLVLGGSAANKLLKKTQFAKVLGTVR